MADGQVLTVGTMTVRAMHTPGHTPGSTCLLVGGGVRPLLLTGDTMFAGGTGRCDLPGGSRPRADASLQGLLASLPDATVVLPGHGGLTTVGRERGDQLSLPTVAA
jgi:glyoxylase-like metal-dependent hydrolase (beta-lactamase superfamily II)